MKRARKGCLWMLLLLAGLVAVGISAAVYQGRRPPQGRPLYVAMGSSFAAGAGLGPLQEGSPWLCARSTGGYPPRVARQLEIPSVDRSCGGATAVHVLRGGQFFQGPQLDSVTKETRLVTLTVGGNDIGYIGDLSMLAARRSESLFGRAVGLLWNGPAATRDWDGLAMTLRATFREVHRRAPAARIVVATYPTILPASGTCPALSLSPPEANAMRAVAARLGDVTRLEARRAGAILVDMDRLGQDHHACSPAPWTFGWTNAGAAPFHPTAAGAEATAREIVRAVSSHQQL